MQTALGQNQSKIHLNIKIDVSKHVSDLVDKYLVYINRCILESTLLYRYLESTFPENSVS